MWSQFFSDLGRDTNTEFSMRVGDPNKSRQDFENGTTSFLITNPMATSTVLERPNAIHVAFINPQWSLVNGGVITAKSDSGYTALDDLKGKKILPFSKSAVAAYLLQPSHIKQVGMNLKDFTMMKSAKKLYNIVLSVMVDTGDAGFVKTGGLESIVKAGKVSLDDFTIIDQQQNDSTGFHLFDQCSDIPNGTSLRRVWLILRYWPKLNNLCCL